MIELTLIGLLPILMAFELNLVGIIFLGELVVLGLLPVMLALRGSRLRDRSLWLVLGLLALYFTAQVLTDVVRQTAFNELARGWSRILLFAANFLVFYLLVGLERGRLLAFAWASVLGGLLYQFVGPEAEFGWKTGFAKPVTVSVILLLAMLPMAAATRRLVLPIALLLLAGLNLALDFRSLSGILTLTAVLVALPSLMRKLGFEPRPLPWRALLPLLGLMAVITAGSLKVYAHFADAGWLGEKAKTKYEDQAAFGDLGLLLGGRNEWLASLPAIQDRPWLGHGSWPTNPTYVQAHALSLWRLGIDHRYTLAPTDLIPTHSHLLGAWVEAGIGGAIFWLGVLVMTLRAIGNLVAWRDPLRPYFLYLLVLFLWDMLFSPFAGFRRVEDAFALLVMLRGLRGVPEPMAKARRLVRRGWSRQGARRRRGKALRGQTAPASGT